MKVQWTEAERHAARDHYYKLLLMHRALPRWYRHAMAERLASLHLEERARQLEQEPDNGKTV